jgi:predicted dehydrogenase
VHILSDLQSLGCEVHVVARSEVSRGRAAKAGAAVVASVDHLPEVEGIVVAVPAAAHAETARRALERGVPVFVEKPLAPDREQALRLAADGGGRLFVMDKWRYHPGVEALAEIARSGELGRPVGLRCVRLGWGAPHTDVDPVWTLAPHDLAIGLEILGEVPPAVAAAGELIGGTLYGIHALLGARPWLTIEVSAASHMRERTVQFFGEEGVAWLPDPYAASVGVARTNAVGAEPEWRAISKELPLLRELRAFLEHIRGGPAPRSSAAEGALIVERLAELRALAASAGQTAVGAGTPKPSTTASRSDA